jgi:hypothetical protein
MATEEEVRRAQALMAQGQLNIRRSAEGTNDWLDDITETLAAATKLLNDTMSARPETKAAYIPVLEQLVQLSLRMITMRHDVTSGQPPQGPVDNAGGRREDDDMNARITALEKDVSAIKVDVAVIKANGATKSDIADTKATISDAKTSIILWVAGVVILAQVLPAVLKLFPQ